jgi:hypothetical protein
MRRRQSQPILIAAADRPLPVSGRRLSRKRAASLDSEAISSLRARSRSEMPLASPTATTSAVRSMPSRKAISPHTLPRVSRAISRPSRMTYPISST